MPRGRMSKVDILARVYKIKNELYNGTHYAKNKEWHDGAHDAWTQLSDEGVSRVDNGFSRPEAAGDLVALDIGGLSA